jgi:DNA gyrase subunit A
VAASTDGYALTFGLEPFVEPSTRSGRRFAKVGDGAAIIGVDVVHGDETVMAVSKKRRALLCGVDEINYLSGAGKGVLLMKLEDDDAILAIKVARNDRDTLVVKTSMGGEQRINPGRFEKTSRGGKGREVMSRGSLTEVVVEAPPPPQSLDPNAVN